MAKTMAEAKTGFNPRRWGARAVDFFFPPLCPLCMEPMATHPGLCATCRPKLIDAPNNLCRQCGLGLSQSEPNCISCLLDPYAPDAALFGFTYANALERLIPRFKYYDQSVLGETLANLFQEKLDDQEALEEIDGVVPVPLHRRRLFQRRFNQAALLAGALAKRWDKPFLTSALFRVKAGERQVGKSREARKNNVKGAFKAVPKRIAGRNLLLVDDVYTTGATIGEATRVLKKAGAQRVVIACLAKTDLLKPHLWG